MGIELNIIKKIIKINLKFSKWIKSKFPRLFLRRSYKDQLIKKIESNLKAMDIKFVLEVGGVDRPLLRKGKGFVYDGLDIAEIYDFARVYDHYLVQSIEKKIPRKYDLIISITLLEHVLDNKASIFNIYESLNSNGITHHYIPSKWHPYSISLRIIGPFLQKMLIPILRPGTENITGYPAYFNHCSVPSMRKLFEKQGFSEIEIEAFYGANDYFEFCTPIYILVTIFENLCKKLKFNIFASGFIITGKKSKSNF